MSAPEPPPTILVIDDNAENRALAQATLEDEGHTVELAASGEEGIARFVEVRPDCVLLDVRMPGMDGFTVCSRLRELPEGKATPILFLTAHRDVDTFDRALRVGGDDFLTKPVRPTELVVRVSAALRLGRMGAELRDQVDLVRRQRDDLMRLSLQKERLTAFVVHDLKNPVNAMDLHAQLLLRDKDLSPRARDSVRQIRGEARALLRMVLNLLDISKSEEGRLEPRKEDVDLAALAAEVCEAEEVKAEAAGVTLVRAIEAQRVRGDIDLLRRLLENLVENALRFAPRGTSVRIDAIDAGDAIVLRVTDAGPGVPPDLRETVFERFVQLESGERLVARSGRGLGLAFVKLVAEAHGGDVSVGDAAPGAVFSVRLPR